MADKKQNRRNNKNYDEDYNPRFRKQRKKVCVLCSDKNFELDYKNPEQLRKFINDKGKILPRRTTGACAKHQRDITIAVKEQDILLCFHTHKINLKYKQKKETFVKKLFLFLLFQNIYFYKGICYNSI